MGKLQSKHVCKSRDREGPEGQCFLLNAKLGALGDLEAQFEGQQELSVTLAEDSVPLRVWLPPTKLNNETAHILTLDKEKSNMKPWLESETDNTKVDKQPGINVEEFECGVSVEGSDKQEWSFTLYDFDGRGKITREDLAQLMKSLYDAVGSSIHLPQGGMKTLKLRLTVTPDQTKLDASQDQGKMEPSQPKPTKDSIAISKQNKDNSRCIKDSNLLQNNMNKHTRSGENAKAHKEVKNNLSASQSKAPTTKSRMSLTEHKQLADIIQKNMERHQQRQQQLRRHNSDHRGSSDSPHYRSRHQHSGKTYVPHECPDRRNYYLDLAGVENYDTEKLYNMSELHNMSAPAAVHVPHLFCHPGHRRSHNHTARTKPLQSRVDQCVSHSHQRSRSHDLTHRNDIADKSAKGKNEATAEKAAKVVEEDNVMRSPRPKARLTSTPKKGQKFRPVSLPGHIPESASPHHHRRHRHRERDHDMAMQHVAEWIQREHPLDLNAEGERVIIQRHEHHHVHEHHHHHHYHHYQET